MEAGARREARECPAGRALVRAPAGRSVHRPPAVQTILALQRRAGNCAVSDLLAGAAGPVQRCGAHPCDCPGDEQRHGLAEHATAVQRVAADLVIPGKSGRAAADPRSLYFDRGQVAPDGAETAKVTGFAPTLPPHQALNQVVSLRGTTSEDEGDQPARTLLAFHRVRAVSDLLTAAVPGRGTPHLDLQPDATVGNLDYRSVRRVEMIVLPAPPVLDCSQGADIPCPPSVATAMDRAEVMLATAFNMLTARDSDAISALDRIFGGGDPARATVLQALTAIRTQLGHARAPIPLRDRNAPGHRCINACEGDVFAYNSGRDTAARLTMGPGFLNAGDVDEQALVLIHELSHAALGLATADRAYRHQRLMAHLAPVDALGNADSYRFFVELCHDPAAAPGQNLPVDTYGTPFAPMTGQEARDASRSLAWLEHYLMQVRLEVRSLYTTLHAVMRQGAWQLPAQGAMQNTMAAIAFAFGLTPANQVPRMDDVENVAGIHDRLGALQSLIASTSFAFVRANVPYPRFGLGISSPVLLPAPFFARAPRQQVDDLLIAALQAHPGLVSPYRGNAWLHVLRVLSARHGGP